MAFVIAVDGQMHSIGYKPNLETKQKAVGGLIERVELKDVTFYVNEEGLILGLPVNEFFKNKSGLTFHGPIVVLEDDDY